MRSKLIGLALATATVGSIALYPWMQSNGAAPLPHTPPNPPPHLAQTTQRPVVDVVFALDTTGSMGGLLETAKEKIWSIATTMSQADPAPLIRIGLVGYRDRGDTYVTQLVPLSSDLDSVYAKLMDFNANGGGDGPESVNQALNDAVTKFTWSQSTNAYKVIFLVGDAPPHMDYQDDVKYPTSLALANAKGIIVNTIQCGQDGSATTPWQQIAALGAGKFFQVEQSGSAVAIATPFDAKLAALAARLDDTRMYYGSKEARSEKDKKIAATDKLNADASVASRARRATFNASPSGATNLLGDGELIDDLEHGKVALDKINPALLPTPLRAMTIGEQAKTLAEKSSARQELKQAIGELVKQRSSFLKDEVAAQGGAAKSLDQQVFGAVREQAAKTGLRYKADAPAY